MILMVIKAYHSMLILTFKKKLNRLRSKFLRRHVVKSLHMIFYPLYVFFCFRYLKSYSVLYI